MPAPAAIPFDDLPAAHVEDTPDTPTIQTLVDHLNAAFPRDDRPWAAADTLKNVLVLLRHPNGETEPLAVGVPGDREVDAKRLEAQVSPAEVEAFDEVQFAKHPSLAKGYIGPGALGSENVSKIRYLVDPAVVSGTSWVTGADQPGKHVIGLVAGRDFTPDGVIHAAEIRDGDPSPGPAGGVLQTARGIEMGHIFQLGRKYAEALDLKVLDQNGKLVTVTMGSYGIGVSRAVAAIAEDNHDDKGLAWPREIAPYDVHLVIAGKGAELFDGGRCGRRRAVRRGRLGAARRPAGLAGGEVRRRRAARDADDRGHRPLLGHRHRRGPRPGVGGEDRGRRRRPGVDGAGGGPGLSFRLLSA